MDDDKPGLVTVTLKLPAEVLEAYGAAAKAASLNRHQWMRLVLDSACGRSDLPNQLMRVVQFVPPKPVRDGQW